MRTLYLEDNPHDALLVRRALAAAQPPIELDVVTSLAQARTALARRPVYDVLLADLSLPDGNATELLTELRAQGLPVAVVALTSHGDESVVMSVLKAGADDYLAKSEGYYTRVPATLRAALQRFRGSHRRHAGALRVLYAEHNAIDIDLTRRYLGREAAHMRIDGVSDAAAVLSRLPTAAGQACDVDVLLLDYRLAGDNGLEVLKILRVDRGLDLPVVMVTGQGSEDVAAQAMRLGATDYIIKRENYLVALPAVLENAFHQVSAAREHAALRKSEERLTLVLRGSSDAPWDVNLQDGEVYVSAPLWAMLGHEVPAPGAELATLTALLSQPSRDTLQHRFGIARLGHVGSFEAEVLLRHADGHDVPLLARGYISRNAHGEAVRVSGTCTDLTERKRAEATIRELNASLERRVAERTAELAKAKEAAEGANLSKSSFLARMSHDLRTPLNAVMGFSQLLALDDAVLASPVATQQVRHIFAAGNHLLEMIDEVLDLARIESGGLRLSPESVGTQALMHDCMTLVEPLAAQHRVSMHFVCDDDGLMVHGDRTRLRQVLVNLLTNAIKYNRVDGRVDVRAQAADDRVTITIRDTGIGMTERQLAELFQPFNRLGAEDSGIEGTGLGLVIAKQLVDTMQGDLQAHSEPGVGTTFTLVLPRGVAAAAAADLAGLAAEDAPPAAPPASLRLLYVEDNPTNVILMQAMVALRPDMQLDVAVDGPSGLAAAQGLRPDLLLLDIDLPGMSGFDVQARLAQDPATAGIPCIAVSANALSTEIERARAAGFADYLTKPFTIDRLFRMINAHAPAGTKRAVAPVERGQRRDSDAPMRA
jgi:PAS domain S-box-containing protein